ncbi:MAG: hypothetical protein ACI4KA_07885 [Oscillospiraceae bacterium]
MSNTMLRLISALGIFVSVFPFVVLCEGVGNKGFVLWHYAALYGVFLVFFLIGAVCSSWGNSKSHSRGFRPVAVFLSKSAVVLPLIAYCAVSAALELSGAFFLYIIPAVLIIYKGGYSSSGRDYSEIFGRGWFALFFVSAVIVSVITWFTRDNAIISSANLQLCMAFGVIIVISSVLTNQTNIDICTHQRDSSRVSLPNGLRGYNFGLSAMVSAATAALFLLVPPLARGAAWLIKRLIALLLALLQRGDESGAERDLLTHEGESGALPGADSGANAINLMCYAVVLVIVVLAVKFRRQIWEFLRDAFSFMLKEREENSDIAYYDEFISTDGHSSSVRDNRRSRREVYKAFVKETDAARKYRLGYRYMLLRLSDTPFAVLPSDNTDIHSIKGENGLRNSKVNEIVSVYNKVRYSDYVPDEEEISFAESFIEEIRR